MFGRSQEVDKPLASLLKFIGPGRCGSIFENIFFKLIIQHSSLSTRCEIAFGRMPQNLTN